MTGLVCCQAPSDRIKYVLLTLVRWYIGEFRRGGNDWYQIWQACTGDYEKKLYLSPWPPTQSGSHGSWKGRNRNSQVSRLVWSVDIHSKVPASPTPADQCRVTSGSPSNATCSDTESGWCECPSWLSLEISPPRFQYLPLLMSRVTEWLIMIRPETYQEWWWCHHNNLHNAVYP